MSLVRYETSPLSALLGDLDSLWSDDSAAGSGRSVERTLYPEVDITETEDGFTIAADLPGIVREDLSINIENGVLTIAGEKKTAMEKPEKNRYFHFERRHGRFSRSFSLPDNVDSAGVEARFSNGVLEITIKKAEEKKPRAIEVKIQ